MPSRGTPVLERNTADLEEWKTSIKQPHSLAAGEVVVAEAVYSISSIWFNIAAVWRRIVFRTTTAVGTQSKPDYCASW